ncbi:hypothetical protein BLA29_001093 [Euroglyphus maynei]|uniref:DhaK domain-containing protein n=1 Tax=Euroglyphus maynei TaxID=6958 RepID=A0A1Y3BW28_EURMA|nr:hypothetical protein BLA29_001093 [Euroglyphus maynei]
MESQCKYLLNSIDTNIRDHLTGLARTNSNVQIVSDVDAIVRKDVAQLKDRVLLISGGGAGHEPMFAGFVGPRQLTAAISGSYFASPSAGAIMRLVEQIAQPDSNILFIQANYTGDRLNFGLAIEYLRLHGYKNLGWFVFGDDIAPFVAGGDMFSEECQIKRRGLAGIVFVHRIAGVLSERGQSLSQILDYLNRISLLPPTFATLSRLMINGRIGGTSGAIYSILFTAAHHFIITNLTTNETQQQQQQRIFWLKLLEYCFERISTYGGARINDRSMIGNDYKLIEF